MTMVSQSDCLQSHGFNSFIRVRQSPSVISCIVRHQISHLPPAVNLGHAAKEQLVCPCRGTHDFCPAHHRHCTNGFFGQVLAVLVNAQADIASGKGHSVIVMLLGAGEGFRLRENGGQCEYTLDANLAPPTLHTNRVAWHLSLLLHQAHPCRVHTLAFLALLHL